MKNTAHALAVTFALALGALSTAHADSPVLSGEASYPSLTAQPQASTLTREAVVADLMAARANGTLPDYPEASIGAEQANGSNASVVTRAQVREEAVAAAHHHSDLYTN